MELWTSHAKKQFETFSAQAKELAELGQKVATETVEPIKASAAKYQQAGRLIVALTFEEARAGQPGLFCCRVALSGLSRAGHRCPEANELRPPPKRL